MLNRSPARFALVLAFSALLTLALGAGTAQAATRIGVVYSSISQNAPDNNSTYYPSRVRGVEDMLKPTFGTANVIEVNDSQLSDYNQLKQFDCLVFVRTSATTAAQRNAIRQYVARGGGSVAMFNLSCFDYNPSRPDGGDPTYNTRGYYKFNYYYGFSASNYMSLAYEWGDLSELLGVRFYNDPLFSPNAHMIGDNPGSHPILSSTSSNYVDLVDTQYQYNEFVDTFPGRTNVKPLLWYRNASVSDPRGRADGSLAGWAQKYYFGRSVYYDFQLYDLGIPGFQNNSVARAMLINSVKWAAAPSGWQSVRKNPDVNARVSWESGNTLHVAEGLNGISDVQTRGYLKLDVYGPWGGSPAYSYTAFNQPVPISPGESYMQNYWIQVGTHPSPGRWRLRCTYTYYDFYRGGDVVTYRDIYADSNGSGMWWVAAGNQVWPDGHQPVLGVRMEGAARWDTAASISFNSNRSGVSPGGAVILAGSNTYTDPIAAAPLAGKLGAPILTTPNTDLPASTVKELKRLYAAKPASATIYVVSDAKQVPSWVIDQAKNAIMSAGVANVGVVRLAGADQYATAAQIASEAGTATPGPFSDTAFICTGLGYADALSVGPIAAKYRVPILFTNSASTPPQATQAALSSLGIKHSIIVGSTNAVNQANEDWLERNGYRAASDVRLAGTDRYDTCVKAIGLATGTGKMGTANLYVATGQNFPDAVALAPLAARGNGSILLVHGTELGNSAASVAYILGRRPAPPSNVMFAGSAAAVSDYVRGQMNIGFNK